MVRNVALPAIQNKVTAKGVLELARHGGARGDESGRAAAVKLGAPEWHGAPARPIAEVPASRALENGELSLILNGQREPALFETFVRGTPH